MCLNRKFQTFFPEARADFFMDGSESARNCSNAFHVVFPGLRAMYISVRNSRRSSSCGAASVNAGTIAKAVAPARTRTSLGTRADELVALMATRDFLKAIAVKLPALSPPVSAIWSAMKFGGCSSPPPRGSGTRGVYRKMPIRATAYGAWTGSNGEETGPAICRRGSRPL